ncbi:hypothetical protein FEZ18_12800 [Oceanihabitans sp. IOP_32]|uniref:hypothetical protein n=1 Tax=Oceanihabitans sp. IOP_32 TaxID=2529032 RepID=UPI0012934B61|nr:hypothetical protein [Oceanihabitans sp. IOP_32]QFZ55619.1 hypothetical protein FEZ18_12800 [Oceanihabitans sp. IOP_32]
MKKSISLILGVIAMVNVFYTFNNNSETGEIFGFEMNIWVYRLIWSTLAVGIFYDYSKKKSTTK